MSSLLTLYTAAVLPKVAMNHTKSKSEDLLDIDDFEMDELLSEFAKENKTNGVVRVTESDNELDSLVEEFAAVQSDSDDEKKSGVKVILSSSDNEIDELLDEFKEENKPKQLSGSKRNKNKSKNVTKKVQRGKSLKTTTKNKRKPKKS